MSLGILGAFDSSLSVATGRLFLPDPPTLWQATMEPRVAQNLFPEPLLGFMSLGRRAQKTLGPKQSKLGIVFRV